MLHLSSAYHWELASDQQQRGVRAGDHKHRASPIK